MLLVNERQQEEIARYEAAYRHSSYAMGAKRQSKTQEVLQSLPKGSLLDVGAGRGEGVRFAKAAGHAPVVGVEPVDYLVGGSIILGVATDLPFGDESFDTVMCLDVLEHLIPEDVEPALVEMKRVAKERLFLTASDQPHRFKDIGDLHISRRPLPEWVALFGKVFEGASMRFLGKVGVSPGWLVEL